MIILGIDPGYGRLGYAVLKKENNKEQLMDYDCINTNPKNKHEKRLLKIAQEIKKIIQKYKPSVLVIEKLFFTSNQKTALRVSEVKGIVIFLATEAGLKIVEYTPLEVKTAICGYGKANKSQVKKMVNLLIKLDKKPKYDDTIDAIALCLTYSARFAKY